MSFIHKQLLIEALRFALVGAVATALHYGLYLLLLAVMPANAAYTLGYVVSFVVNFYLTAYFTFGTGPSWRKLVGMGGAHAVNYGLHLCLLNAFLALGVTEVWAPLPVFAIAIPVNFLLVRFVFKRGKRRSTARRSTTKRSAARRRSNRHRVTARQA